MMRYKQLALIILLSFLLLTKHHAVHAAAHTDSINYILMSSNTQTVIPGIPTQTPTSTVIPSDTPTTTLLPLPAITLIFPITTGTSTPTNTPKPINITAG